MNRRSLTVHQSLLYFLSAGHHERPILNNCLVKGLSSNLTITDSVHMKNQESLRLRTKISSVSPSGAVTATPVSSPPVERTRVWKASCGKVSAPMDIFPFKTWNVFWVTACFCENRTYCIRKTSTRGLIVQSKWTHDKYLKDNTILTNLLKHSPPILENDVEIPTAS